MGVEMRAGLTGTAPRNPCLDGPVFHAAELEGGGYGRGDEG